MSKLRAFFSRNAYRKEILLVIVLKLVLLGLLWEVCFSTPVEKGISKKELQQHFDLS